MKLIFLHENRSRVVKGAFDSYSQMTTMQFDKNKFFWCFGKMKTLMFAHLYLGMQMAIYKIKHPARFYVFW